MTAKIRAEASADQGWGKRVDDAVPGGYRRAGRGDLARFDHDAHTGATRYDGSMSTTTPQTHGPITGPLGRRVVAHRQELLEILRRHGATNPEIFGSAARGEDREDSDLDLLVDLAPGTDLIDMVNLKAELDQVLGTQVDLIPRDGLRQPMRESAARDSVPLGAAPTVRSLKAARMPSVPKAYPAP